MNLFKVILLTTLSLTTIAYGGTFDPNKRMVPFDPDRRMQVAECCGADHQAMGYRGGVGTMNGGISSYGNSYQKDQSRMTGADPTSDHLSAAAPTSDHPAGYGAGGGGGGAFAGSGGPDGAGGMGGLSGGR